MAPLVMALLKTRPDVRLLLPRPLVAGELASFIVELECPKPVPVDAVSLSLFGDMVWYTTSQYGRHRHTSRFLEHHAPLLAEGTELEAGTHRLQTQVRLSDQLLASWTGDQLAVQYGVEVHVDIPWWPDKRVEFVVRVEDTGRVRADEGPIVFATRTSGPPAKGAYLELSLGQRSVVPGGPLRLSAALGNVQRNEYRKLDLALLAHESFPTGLGGHYVNEHPVARWSVALADHGDELQPIPFSLELPDNLVPAFELHGCRLTWILAVSADVAWGVDPKLRVPMIVQPPAVRPQGESAAPLAVGSDRLRLIWSKVAHEHGLELAGDRIHGHRGALTIDVWRTYEHGTAQVVGQLEYPELGLGLRTKPERRGLLGELEVHFHARDAGQSAVVDELLGDAVRAVDYELVKVDDRRIAFAFEGAGLEIEPLASFVAWLDRLPLVLAQLRERVPPPAVMAAHVDAWTRASAALSARLRQTDLCLSFERDGMELSLSCVYDEDGQVRATRLEIEPKLTIPTRQQLLWTGDGPPPEHELELDELVARPTWAASGRIALHIDSHRIRVLLPAPLPDPLLERPRIEALVAFGRRLRGEHGPYR